MKSENIEVLPEYLVALESIKNNPCTAIIGNAGSGKSTFIKWIKRNTPNTVVLAPTGIAAINIQGRTIHSYFHLPPTFITPDAIKILDRNKAAKLKAVKLIIIDEISMVNSNQLDAIDEYLQVNLKNKKPFGGIPVLLVGDLFQIPPIVTDATKPLFDEYYSSPMFYGSSVIQELQSQNKFKLIKLEHVMRQKDDVFVEILNNIRVGNDVINTVNKLNSLVTIAPTVPDGYIQITPYNKVCEQTNRIKMDMINSPICTYNGSITGRFKTNNVPVPMELSLKVGAQVMVCRNIDDNIVNGTIGMVTKMESDCVYIKLSTGQIVPIEAVTWEEYGYSRNGSLVESSVVGDYTQIPLKLAYSITIHKVQGLTISKLFIDMDKGAFTTGQLYVALSRAVSLDGLAFSKPISRFDVMVDAEVQDFCNTFD